MVQQGMDRLIEIAAEHHLPVVSDEVYRLFAAGYVSAAHAPARDPYRHLVADSCSKALAVAGLRVGFLHRAAAGPAGPRCSLPVFRRRDRRAQRLPRFPQHPLPGRARGGPVFVKVFEDASYWSRWTPRSPTVSHTWTRSTPRPQIGSVTCTPDGDPPPCPETSA
ncbi:aminotransferase class I/II-fold pyridoxal phosphate-dependent enzyme [Amycolatopsis roodepoortensis]|uniref:aminotransferase class I/II-fold pyridoxal phosphate-dependent enzyme n=1 Tax=Amycolatopsis roodepoortensis TaxID=700274 RepID=UPI0035316B46